MTTAMANLEAHDALKAWLRARLTGEATEGDWPSLLRAAWDQLMSSPVEQVLRKEDVRAVVESYLRPERISDTVRPAVRTILPMVVERLRQDHQVSARWVPDDAKERLRKLASEHGLIHADYVKALFQQKAVEMVMADALYRGIREFSTILPRILLGLLPTSRLPGFGGAGALGKKLLEDLERRLEPEIKSFLAGGTQRALARAADFAIKHMEDPAYVSMRTNMIDFVFSKTPAFHSAPLTQARLDQLEPIVESIAQHVAKKDETHRLAAQVLDSLFERFGKRTVQEALQEAGVRSAPDFVAMAHATWPAVQLYLSAPEIAAWLDKLVDELLAEQSRLMEPRA
jgi:hypothetical protein